MTDQELCDWVMNEAFRLRTMTITRCGITELDRKTAMWIIRDEAWRAIEVTQSRFGSRMLRDYSKGDELMNLPVRRTIGDSADTPMIQLVMEPMTFDTGKARREKP